MKRTALCVLAAAAVCIAGCSKDPVSTVPASGSVFKRMLFSPDTLRTQTYTYAAMKARVDGVGIADVYLNWEFDSMGSTTPYTHLEAAKPITDIFYSKAGTYRIRVSAYDTFNDTLVVRDSTVAIVSASPESVTLFPRSCDTSLLQNPDGTMAQEMGMSVRFGEVSNFFVYHVHVVGPGVDSSFDSPSEDFSFGFPRLGTYNVGVKVTDRVGAYIGSDSARYNIAPTVDRDALLHIKAVGFVLMVPESVANTYFLGDSEMFGALAVRNDSAGSARIDAGGFIVTADQSRVYGSQHIGDHDTIRATFSADLKTLLTFSASNDDTTSTNSYSGWRFDSRNVRLFSVTDSAFVYAVVGLPVGFVAQNEFSYASAIGLNRFNSAQSAFDVFNFATPGRIVLASPTLYVVLRR